MISTAKLEEMTGIRRVFYEAMNRNISVFDADADSGDLTKRLVSLMKVVNRRNGENSVSRIYTPVALDVNKIFDVEIVFSPLLKAISEEHAHLLGVGKSVFCIGVGDGEPIAGMF